MVKKYKNLNRIKNQKFILFLYKYDAFKKQIWINEY